MVYSPQYTTLAEVRRISKVDTNSLSDNDGNDLIEDAEQRVDGLIQADNIDTSGWSPVPVQVRKCATYFSVAMWLSAVATQYQAASGGGVDMLIKRFEKLGKEAWQNYLAVSNLSRGYKRSFITLKPQIKQFDEEEWREQDD